MMSHLRCQYPGDRFPIHCTSQWKLCGVSTLLYLSTCHGTDLSSWLYRIRPSVSHQGFTRLPDNPDVSLSDFARSVLTLSSYQLESTFLTVNPKVHVSATQLAWHPFKLPSDKDKINFLEGLKTIAGNGDTSLREGLAIHVYLANTSMDNKAFCNGDGEMLICPQQGCLDIQTELGKWVVSAEEIRS